MTARLAALALAVLALRWLASARVTVTAAGFPVSMPVLAVVAVLVTAAAAGIAVLVVCRVRAERAALTAWRTRKAAAA